MRLILASSSKHRISLLKRIGYVPDIIYPANLDETPLKREKPIDIASRLAYEKAKAVHLKFSNDLIIAADTVCAVGSLSLPKALTQEEAAFCINKISGRRHRVYTSVCGIYKDRIIKKIGVSVLKIKRLSSEEIQTFLKSKTWFGKAGGYGIEGFMSAFVLMSNRDAYSNVAGLPLYQTYLILTSLGLKPNINVLNMQNEGDTYSDKC